MKIPAWTVKNIVIIKVFPAQDLLSELADLKNGKKRKHEEILLSASGEQQRSKIKDQNVDLPIKIWAYFLFFRVVFFRNTT